jgi:hypothetical protein
MAATTAKDLLTDPVPLSVRLEGPLLQQLRDAARCSLRSVNAEINHRIRCSFEREPHQATAS